MLQAIENKVKRHSAQEVRANTSQVDHPPIVGQYIVDSWKWIVDSSYLFRFILQIYNTRLPGIY